MILTVLTDNLSRGDLGGEWGLSVYIEHGGKKILLDAGQSGLFAENAARLGVDLSAVDVAVLSHAHYDHADGLPVFFAKNAHAPVYLRKGSAEDCYSKNHLFSKYIGIQKGMLAAYGERIRFAEGDTQICPGVWLIPHKTSGLAAAGKAAKLYRRRRGWLYPDDFSHEQSLVIDTDKGLVILNSCSHGGADKIVREIADTFPRRPIAAMIGGFHLFRSSGEDVRQFAERIDALNISRVLTGHCTGDAAFAVLKERLGDRVEQFYAGYRTEI